MCVIAIGSDGDGASPSAFVRCPHPPQPPGVRGSAEPNRRRRHPGSGFPRNLLGSAGRQSSPAVPRLR
jgi:hypothetical protein